MTVTIIAVAVLLLAAVPAGLLLANLRQYRPPPPASSSASPPQVSVLVPARDEEQNIGRAVRSVLASRGVELELLVLDDQSKDGTAEIVESHGRDDARVRLLSGAPLPAGANGKQFACAQLADEARHRWLVFLDADVDLAVDGLARMVAFAERSGASLASGIPRQRLGTWAERLIIPLIHFVLLAFLPLGRMRRSLHPAYGAGAGQLLIARRSHYERAGGHRQILTSRHDGIDLPRAFRRAGLPTDLFDATDIASCRMYQSAAEVWNGFVKNADQGLGAPRAIVPATVLLGAGQIAPFVGLLAAPWLPPSAVALLAAGAALVWLARLLSARRFRQPLLAALMHPVSVALLLAIQWHGLIRLMMRRPARWKGRDYLVEQVESTRTVPKPRAATWSRGTTSASLGLQEKRT